MNYTKDISWVCIVENTDGHYQVYLVVNPEHLCRDEAHPVFTLYYRRFSDTVNAIAYRIGLCRMPAYSFDHLIGKYNPEKMDLTPQIIREYNEIIHI